MKGYIYEGTSLYVLLLAAVCIPWIVELRLGNFNTIELAVNYPPPLKQSLRFFKIPDFGF